MNSREKTLKSTKCIRMESKAGKCMIAKPDEPMESGKEFTFDAVFDDDSNQTEVYQDIAQDLVDSVLEGYNGTIFAYGQTGCGKSFTMMGVPTDPILCGIIPRAFNQIFTAIKLNAVEKKQFLVQGSYIEIYNEEVRDLLGTNHTARLDLKEHPEKGVYVHGVTKHTVSSVEQITKLMDQGHANRSVGATMMNADSSRSHSIFMVEIETSEPVETTDELSIKQGILNLVDLAGSERAGKTGAEGQRLKEATKINLSLSALGNVISALVSGKGHIPYRDSKLTRLLQNSLGGNAKTVMMAAISPASDNYEESLCTLRYANRAKNIKNKPKVNEDPRDALLREYSDEIKRLKDLLQQSGISAGAAAASAGGSFGGGEGASRGVSLGGGLEAEKQRLVDEAQAEIRRLEAEKKTSQEEVQYMLEQFEAERNEAAARISALELASRDGEAARSQLLRREAELKARGGATDEELEQLAEDRAMIEETLEREKETQEALAESLAEKEQRAVLMKKQLQVEDKERDEKAAEVQQRLERLLSQQEAAKEELERKLRQMEEQLLHGGMQAQNAQAQAEAKVAEAARRMMKMKRKQQEAERMRQQEEEQKALLAGHMDTAKAELQDKASQITLLRHKLMTATQEFQDLEEEFERDRQDYLKTIRELTREVALYKAIGRAAYRPGDLQVILRSSSYDDERGEWLLPKVAYPTVFPTVDDARSGARTLGGVSAGAYADSFGSDSRGPNTLATNPGAYETRADANWRRSIRSDFGPSAPPDSARRTGGSVGPRSARFAPAPPTGSKPYSGMYGELSLSTSSTKSTAADVNPEVINSLPRRPGFAPSRAPEAKSAASPTAAGSDSSFASLDSVRARPGFAPASSPSASSAVSPHGGGGSAGPDLSGLQRRPGFAPAANFGAASSHNAGVARNDTEAMLATVSQTARRPGFAPAAPN